MAAPRTAPTWRPAAGAASCGERVGQDDRSRPAHAQHPTGVAPRSGCRPRARGVRRGPPAALWPLCSGGAKAHRSPRVRHRCASIQARPADVRRALRRRSRRLRCWRKTGRHPTGCSASPRPPAACSNTNGGSASSIAAWAATRHVVIRSPRRRAAAAPAAASGRARGRCAG
jgi:hypothetical protein